MKKVVLASVPFLLAACGNNEENSSGDKLEVFIQKPEMQKQLNEIVQDFNNEFDANLEVVSVPDSGTVLKTRMANGDAPDIINIFPQNADFQEWASAGEFVELADQPFMDKIAEGAAEEYAINDGLYSLPLTTNAWGFFYNQDKFDELNLTPPSTWTEFEELVDKINDAGETPFAGSFSTQDSWTLNGYHQLAWAKSTGGSEEANNYLRHSEKDAINPQDSELQSVASDLNLLIDNAQNNANGASYADAVASFAKQDGLIFPNGIWALPAINEQNPEFTVRSFAYPGENEGEERTVGAADLAWSVSEKSDNKELALQFLEYMTRNEVFEKYYEVDGMPTSLIDFEKNNAFEETEGITQLTFSDQQMVWLHQAWDSEEGFWHLTVDYINTNGDNEALANSLNEFFNPMKN